MRIYPVLIRSLRDNFDAHAYNVKPLIRNHKSFYSATFKNARGERVSRGLGTNNRGTAGLICAGLVTLLEAGITCAADIPIDVSHEATRLDFGKPRP